MATYDWESLGADIETVMTDNLNTKLTAITTEKGDSLSLKSVGASAYFFQSLDNTVVSYDPYIFYAIESVDAEGVGPAVAEDILVSIWLVLQDPKEDLSTHKRMLRYARALKEIFLENWDSNSKRGKIMIESFKSEQFTNANTSDDYRVAHVNLRLNMFS